MVVVDVQRPQAAQLPSHRPRRLVTHNCDVGHKSAIHDVHVDPVCSSLVHCLNLREHRSALDITHEQNACLSVNHPLQTSQTPE